MVCDKKNIISPNSKKKKSINKIIHNILEYSDDGNIVEIFNNYLCDKPTELNSRVNAGWLTDPRSKTCPLLSELLSL